MECLYIYTDTDTFCTAFCFIIQPMFYGAFCMMSVLFPLFMPLRTRLQSLFTGAASSGFTFLTDLLSCGTGSLEGLTFSLIVISVCPFRSISFFYTVSSARYRPGARTGLFCSCTALQHTLFYGISLLLHGSFC